MVFSPRIAFELARHWEDDEPSHSFSERKEWSWLKHEEEFDFE